MLLTAARVSGNGAQELGNICRCPCIDIDMSWAHYLLSIFIYIYSCMRYLLYTLVEVMWRGLPICNSYGLVSASVVESRCVLWFSYVFLSSPLENLILCLGIYFVAMSMSMSI